MKWGEVPAIDRNGIITQFEVMYEPQEAGGSARRNVTDASTFNILLDGLEEYVEYSITVRAVTAAGGGPFSSAISVQTPEGSTIVLMKQMLTYKIHDSV